MINVGDRPWKRAAAWLAVLLPLFFASYGFANWLAGTGTTRTIAFSWERSIPFLPLTIVPYLSFDLLYCVSLFLCTTRRELDRHAARLLTAQAVCVAVFIAAPFRFSLTRPATNGMSGALFKVLDGFDKPYNQMPSLHIANLVIVWACFARHTSARWRWALHAWMTLIAVSTLTTFQHHFIDLPAGLVVGFATLWAFPELSSRAPARDPEVMSDHRSAAPDSSPSSRLGMTFQDL